MRGGEGRPRRVPRPPTAASLERAALRHLERFPCSAARLRQVLEQRIRRAEGLSEAEAEALRAGLAGLVERLERQGWLDDAALARGLVASFQRRGLSPRGMAAKLRARQVPEVHAAAALEALAESLPDPERAAAARYAQRRRLGPFQPDAERRAARRDRDLAALGRQGFSYGLAREVVDGALAEVEGWLAE